MKKKIRKELESIVSLWLKWSLTQQDKIFNSTRKNRSIFKKAKSLATY